jgi:hypothetical protein
MKGLDTSNLNSSSSRLSDKGAREKILYALSYSPKLFKILIEEKGIVGSSSVPIKLGTLATEDNPK